MLNTKITRYTYISFDIFDTLIKRNVLKPTDVFDIVEKRYNSKGISNISDFTYHRASVERELRQSREKEVTLAEIYEKLAAVYGQEIAIILKKIECQTEIDCCCSNQTIMKVYNRCIAEKKKVLIITDMYLDRDTICQMLDKCGYKLYDKLYISSESGVTKETGELFKYIKDELRIEASQWLHIGDNKKSDYLMAIKNGIYAKHIPTFINRLSYAQVPNETTLSDSRVMATLNNYIDENSKLWERFGFECLGPMLVGFVNWLKYEIVKEDIKKVYFLSRDGYLIQRIYEMSGEDNIQSQYLYASRRALQVPAFYINSEYETVINSFFLPRQFKLETLVRKLGLEYEMVEKIGINHHYTKDTVIQYRGILENKQLRSFYSSIRPKVEENARIEYEALIGYLKKNEFEGRVAIVDIGWFGNMQSALNKIVKHAEIDVEIYGYYMGLVPEGQQQKYLNMKGYLFSAKHNQELYPKERIFNAIFESLFLGNHGSVKKYYKNKEEIEVELYPYECCGQQMESEIRMLQEGAVNFARHWYENLGDINLQLSAEFVFRPLCKIGMSPSREWAKNLGEWKFFDIDNCYIAKPLNFIQYLKRPKQLIYDLNSAPWKVGFLKRVFKFRLPYYDIWMFIREIYKKGEEKNG